MRYCCDLPGFEDNFIELSDVWSRKQVKSFWQFEGEAYMALLKTKVVSCNLACPDGPPITEAFLFTEEGLEQVDFRIYHWVVNVPVKHVSELGTLSLACGRRLFASTEDSSAPPSDDPAKLPTEPS